MGRGARRAGTDVPINSRVLACGSGVVNSFRARQYHGYGRLARGRRKIREQICPHGDMGSGQLLPWETADPVPLAG